jgi:uncharacterized protein involved in exopolysaccharide biosynthesis
MPNLLFQSYEEEARARQEVQEAVGIADRKANALSGEFEESRALLDTAERSRRQLEAELAEGRNAVNEMSAINTRAMNDKRAVESAIHAMQAEIDDMMTQAKNAEEKAKRAMVDAARLADELRAEQEHAQTEDRYSRMRGCACGCNLIRPDFRHKRALEQQLSELSMRLADAEDLAMKSGRAAMSKLEARIRELEIELGNTQSHTSEVSKAYQRTERRSVYFILSPKLRSNLLLQRVRIQFSLSVSN